jgi:hypothetical protein
VGATQGDCAEAGARPEVVGDHPLMRALFSASSSVRRRLSLAWCGRRRCFGSNAQHVFKPVRMFHYWMPHYRAGHSGSSRCEDDGALRRAASESAQPTPWNRYHSKSTEVLHSIVLAHIAGTKEFGAYSAGNWNARTFSLIGFIIGGNRDKRPNPQSPLKTRPPHLPQRGQDRRQHNRVRRAA